MNDCTPPAEPLRLWASFAQKAEIPPAHKLCKKAERLRLALLSLTIACYKEETTQVTKIWVGRSNWICLLYPYLEEVASTVLATSVRLPRQAAGIQQKIHTGLGIPLRLRGV